MSGTALYRALINAGSNEELAKEAAMEIDDMKNILIEVRISVRIIIVILFVVIGILVKLLTIS